MTPEEMKHTWDGSKEWLCTANENYSSLLKEMKNDKRKTALDRLKNRYLRFSRVAVAFIVFCPMWIRLINQPTLNITLTAIMVLYFTTASIMDYWLYRRVSEIDIFTMKVKTVTEIAKTCKKRHHQFMMILIPLCILTLGLMAYCVIDEPYVLIGMITGDAIGLAIGCQKYFDFMKDYHTLSDNDND